MYNVSLREYSTSRDLDIGLTGAEVATGGRTLFGWAVYNNNSSTVYLKLYNKATVPTETDTPKMTIALGTKNVSNVEFFGGIPFNLGIWTRGTTGVADADVAAPTTNDIVGNIIYK